MLVDPFPVRYDGLLQVATLRQLLLCFQPVLSVGAGRHHGTAIAAWIIECGNSILGKSTCSRMHWL